MLAFTRSLSNSIGLKSSVQALLQNKIETYLERKYRISRSHSTRDSYRVIVYRFIDFLHIFHNYAKMASIYILFVEYFDRIMDDSFHPTIARC